MFESVIQNLEKKRARKGQGITAGLMGIMIAVIIGVAVVMPVVNDVIVNSSITGTASTILNIVPVLIAAVVVVAVASLFYLRQ